MREGQKPNGGASSTRLSAREKTEVTRTQEEGTNRNGGQRTWSLHKCFAIGEATAGTSRAQERRHSVGRSATSGTQATKGSRNTTKQPNGHNT